MIQILSGILTVGLFAVTGYSIYDIVSTGAWKSWGVLDWLANIGFTLLALNPIYKALKASVLVKSAVGGGLMAKLTKVPLIGSLCVWVWEITSGFRMMIYKMLHPLLRKGGFLYELGRTSKGFVTTLTKRPWLIAAMFFASSMVDGIFQRIYQLWGDLTMRAANVMFEQVGKIMQDKGFGNPISEAISILDGSRSTLPPCFTAVWGTVGASECIGLIITTFQYLFLIAALRQGYKIYGRTNT